MRFQDKVVLVTGSSMGIGKAAAIEFAKEGADVILNYVKSEKDALQVKSEIEKLGCRAMIVKCDVSDEKQVVAMIDEIAQTFKHIDILVNNAGIVSDVEFKDRTVEQFRKTLDVNLVGMFIVSKKAIPLMKKGSRIINISSISGLTTWGPTSIDYDASKAGIVSFTKGLARELAPDILVNTVAPGWVNTPMNKDLPEDYVQEETRRIALKRFADPAEIAKTILFLASDDASYITGSVLVVDGGYS